MGVLCLAGCEQFRQFQQAERNQSAKEYKELNLFNQDSKALANLPKVEIAPKAQKNYTTNKVNWMPLFNGKDLTGWEETDYAGRGKVVVKNGELHIENGLVITGVNFTNKTILPKTNYEITYQA